MRNVNMSALISRSIWMDEWNDIQAAHPAADVASYDALHADVAVVGAGFTGLTVAYRLASAGKRVVVLESEHVGHGASLRNAGFCTASAPFSATAAIQRHGARSGSQLLRWFFDAPNTVRQLLAELGADGGWTESVRLVLARTPAEGLRLRNEAQLLRQTLGRDMQYLDATEIGNHVGHGEFTGALRDADSACLDPAQLLAALLSACASAGVRVLEQAAVTKLTRTGGRFRVDFGAATVDAGEVVIATNGYTGKLGVGAHKLVIPVGSFIIASHPLSAEARANLAPTNTVFSTASRFPNYFRLTSDGRMLFGGRRSLSYESSIDSVASELVVDLRRLLPGLDFELDRCWGGRLAFTSDREPVMGQLDDKLHFVGGYCGHGVPTSVACANELAELILGRRTEAPVFYRRRLSTTVLPQIATFLLPAIGTYYRARDRLDGLAVRYTNQGK